mgnify:CR=1 FL=1
MYIKEHKCSIMENTTFSIEQKINNKMYKFHTNDYGFEWDVEYDYRVITKCVAGFMTISDGKSTLQNLVNRYQKNALQTIEVKSLQSDNYLTVFPIYLSIYLSKYNIPPAFTPTSSM